MKVCENHLEGRIRVVRSIVVEIHERMADQMYFIHKTYFLLMKDNGFKVTMVLTNKKHSPLFMVTWIESSHSKCYQLPCSRNECPKQFTRAFLHLNILCNFPLFHIAWKPLADGQTESNARITSKAALQNKTLDYTVWLSFHVEVTASECRANFAKWIRANVHLFLDFNDYVLILNNGLHSFVVVVVGFAFPT